MHAPSSHYFWQVFGIFFVPFFVFFLLVFFVFFDVFYGKAACIEHFVLVNCACCTRRMRYMRARTPRMHCTYAQLCSRENRENSHWLNKQIFSQTPSPSVSFSPSCLHQMVEFLVYIVYIYMFFSSRQKCWLFFMF